MKYFAINNLSACEKVEGYMSNLDSFVKVVEDNLYTHLGRGFDSLNFYHTMRQSENAAKGTTL